MGITSQHDVLVAEAFGLPADLPTSTYEMICRGAAVDSSAPALSFIRSADAYREPECWTYGELVRDITRTANMLTRLGVGLDSVVAYLLPNLPETHFVIWGGEAAGIVCAINPLLEANAIAELLNASGASVLVTVGAAPGFDLWQKVQSALPRVHGLRHVVVIDMASRLAMRAADTTRPAGEAAHALDEMCDDLPTCIEVHDFWNAITRESGVSLDSGRRFARKDRSSYFCTGGTTGLPKIAVRCHGNEVANAWSTSRFFGESIGRGKTIFCGLPLFHVNAVMATGLLPFSTGAHVVLGTPQGYRGDGVVNRFWEIVEHYRVNFFSGVPTLYASLLDVPIGARDVGSLEYGLCGAAPMPVEVFRVFQERTGVRIVEGYGLTEGTCVSSANPLRGERRLGSIGLRMPTQHMKAVVVDEAGQYTRDCDTNETGLLVISGPNVFVEYVTPEHNEGLWLDLGDGRRWLNTGDLGRCDADGYFWLCGRKKELIIRGGHNIDPASIEEPLHRHPAVQIAAAVGRPDAHAGELPVAYVQLKAGACVLEAELADFVRHEIGERAALPRRIRIVDVMPLTGVGKIFKPELRRWETADALRCALIEAGVEGAVVSADGNGIQKNSLHVELPNEALKAAAIEVIGRFAFTVSVSVMKSA